MRPPFPLAAPNAWPEVAAKVADRVYGKLPRPLWELVAIVSDAYNRERDTMLGVSTSSRDGLQARLRFYLPRDAAKALSPLGELARAGLLPQRRWRVLDLGAGLGSTTIGAARVARHLGVPGLDVLAIDQDAHALDGFVELAKEHEALEVAPMNVNARAMDATTLDLSREGPFDLVLAGLVLNEMDLERRLALLERVRPALAKDGAFVILEPALREITRELHRLRDVVDAGEAGDWNVFSPCLRKGPCPMLQTERDWCHEDEPFVLPPALVKVARDASLRYERLTYAQLTLRRDDKTLRDAVGDDTVRVVSMPLVTKGKRELFVCDDAGRTLLRRLDRDASEANADFGDSYRGDVLRVEPGETRVRKEREVRRVGEAPRRPSDGT
ncbi:MAG: class I SAM-dependent methyltransferase [Sandaracinus sp.]|nr:class I SAM-dependent methyltransferase [Myxococcales bacterium]MCB9632525.1 class I SAM-dependent methyltransferase [Sandaracinus sp.]